MPHSNLGVIYQGTKMKESEGRSESYTIAPSPNKQVTQFDVNFTKVYLTQIHFL